MQDLVHLNSKPFSRFNLAYQIYAFYFGQCIKLLMFAILYGKKSWSGLNGWECGILGILLGSQLLPHCVFRHQILRFRSTAGDIFVFMPLMGFFQSILSLGTLLKISFVAKKKIFVKRYSYIIH